MNQLQRIARKLGFPVAGALLIALAAAPCAHATAVNIQFSGQVGTGHVRLTLAPDPNSSSSYQPTYNAVDGANGISPPLSPYDPAGAQHITGASGNFNGIPITGVMPLDQGMAPPGEVLPASFSWIYTAGGPFSYDNLFYADGSPLVCPPTPTGSYPFSGGFLDIYGAMFALGNGDYVGLWSDGIMPGGLTYGINLFTPTDEPGVYSLSSSQFAGVYAAVPEPSFIWALGAALLGLFAWRRSIEVRKLRTSRID